MGMGCIEAFLKIIIYSLFTILLMQILDFCLSLNTYKYTYNDVGFMQWIADYLLEILILTFLESTDKVPS